MPEPALANLEVTPASAGGFGYTEQCYTPPTTPGAREVMTESDDGVQNKDEGCCQNLVSVRWCTVLLCLASVILCATLSTYLVVDACDAAIHDTNEACTGGLTSTSQQAVVSAGYLGDRLMDMVVSSAASKIWTALNPIKQEVSGLQTMLKASHPSELAQWSNVYPLRKRFWSSMYSAGGTYTGIGMITAPGQILGMVEDDNTIGSGYSQIIVLLNNGSEFGDPTHRTLTAWARPWDGEPVGNKLPGQPQEPSGLTNAPATTNKTEARCGCFKYGLDVSTHPDWCGLCTWFEESRGLCTPKVRGWCPEPICASPAYPEIGQTIDPNPSHNTSFILGMCPERDWGPEQIEMWTLAQYSVPTNQARWSPPVSAGPYIGLLFIQTYLHPDALSNPAWYRDSPQGPRSGLVYIGTDLRTFSAFLSSLWGAEGLGKARAFLAIRSDPLNGRGLEGSLVGVSHGSSNRPRMTQWGPRPLTINLTESDDPVMVGAGEYIASMYNGTGSAFDTVYTFSQRREAGNFTVNLNGTQELFLFKLDRLFDEYGLDLWVGVALDWYFVHGELDAATRAVNLRIQNSRAAVDEELDQDRITTYLIVMGLAIVIIIICVALGFILMRPLYDLAEDMELVARLNLEDINDVLSSFSEVRRLQRSFLQMVAMMKEWKAYVPADALLGGLALQMSGDTAETETLFPTTEHDTDAGSATEGGMDDDMQARQNSISLKISGMTDKLQQPVSPRSICRSAGSPRSVGPTVRGGRNTNLKALLQETGTLRFRRGSLFVAETYATLHVDSRPHEHPHGVMAATRLISTRMSYMTAAVLEVAAQSGATVLMMNAERCYATMNVFRPRNDYSKATAAAALAMAAKLQELDQGDHDKWWSICLATGGCFSANVGTDGRKAPVVISSAMAIINSLSRLAPLIQSRVLATDKLRRVISDSCCCRPVEVVPEGTAPDGHDSARNRAKIRVFELFAQDSLPPDAQHEYLAAFSAMCQGNYFKAKQGFMAVLMRRPGGSSSGIGSDHHSLRLLRYCLWMLKVQGESTEHATKKQPYFRAWHSPWDDHETEAAQLPLPPELDAVSIKMTSNSEILRAQFQSRARAPSISEAEALEREIKKATGQEDSSSSSGDDSGDGIGATFRNGVGSLQPLSICEPCESVPGGLSPVTPHGQQPNGDCAGSTDSSERRRSPGSLRRGRVQVTSPESSGSMSEHSGSSMRMRSGPTSTLCSRRSGIRGRRSKIKSSHTRTTSSDSTGSSPSSSPHSTNRLSTEHSTLDGVRPAVPKQFTTGHGNKTATWFRGEKVLGKGAFGEVWLAMGGAGQLVALKVLPLPPPAKKRARRGLRAQGNQGITQEELQNLVQEVSLMTKLRHESIVWYLASAVVSRNIVIVMEYLPGGSLSGVLSEFGALQLGPARRYIADILDGLAFLHGEGIVHRDLKPANVLLTIEGQCKLADFGASGELASKTQQGGIAGTPLYMAPEAVRRAIKVSDIWSLGITVIQLIHGHLPYEIPETGFNPIFFMRRLERGELSPEVPDTLPHDVRLFVEECIQRDPEKRPTAEVLLGHEFLVASG
eukprot:Hpha_TRINITY_DN14393_c0_g2::TRINITY_DN14393_c0_g2_i1::g.86434::m.86434